MTDPTPLTGTLTGTVTEPASDAPDQMSAPPVENPVDTPAPVELHGDDVATVLAALRTWHRSPDSRLHRRALALADRIDAGTR